MTLQQAIKSKRPFTCKGLGFWIVVIANRFYVEPEATTASTGSWFISKLKFEFDKKKKNQSRATWENVPMKEPAIKLRPVLLTPKTVLSRTWKIRNEQQP